MRKLGHSLLFLLPVLATALGPCTTDDALDAVVPAPADTEPADAAAEHEVPA